MSLQERLQHIKTNWLEIKEKDPDFTAPRAMFHKYYLDKENIPRVNIENFEKNNGFKLPEEYKEYLINVTNGGAGPFSGMYPLHDALYPLNKGTKGEDNYCDWLEKHPDHYVSEFPVTEERIISYLTYKINHASNETPPIPMECDAPGYVFLCTVEPGIHYIMPVNGACVNEIWLLKEAKRINAIGKEELYFNLWPEVRFVNDQIKTLSFLEWVEDAQQNWFNKNVSLDHRLAAVKTTWFNFAAHDREEKVFGAFMHHYQLNEVLPEETVAKFEKQYGCEIPVEYRQYLKLVSNGGVGPFYGMYALENSVRALNSGAINDGTFINYLEKHPDHLSKSFPISEQQIVDYLTQKTVPPSPIKLDVTAGGYLFLAEYGCGAYYVMPVNGPVVGQVWFLQKMNANKLTFEMRDKDGKLVDSGTYGDEGDNSYFELYPQIKRHNDQVSTVNFLEWLEHKQSQWFVEENSGGNDEQQGAAGGGAENLDNENAYYPLTIGNTWTHDFGGQEMVTTIESFTEGAFTTSNSLNPVSGAMKKVNGEYFCDSMEKGNMQLMLKDKLVPGESWEANFKANGLDCIYIYTVKEIIASKTVEGKEYKDVAMVELETQYVINGTRMPMNAFTQNYYAKGVGIVLTTTSGVLGNNSYPLVSYELK